MSTHDEILCTCGCGGAVHSTPIENLPGLSALGFRFGTHSSLKKTMLTALSGKGKETLARFTSRKDNDMSIALLDAWATVLDVISFYQERIINEGYLRTATERYSVVELARHISYTLKPGVAAAGFLTFTINGATGAPDRTTIPAGSKVQSIPAQDELPQLFETATGIEARVEWNAIGLQIEKKQDPVYGSKEIYLKGINTGLQPGDGLLMIGSERENSTTNENWDFRRIKAVTSDAQLDHTKLTWERGLGKTVFGNKVEPEKKDFKVYILKQRAFLFGYNAPDFRTMSEAVKNAFNPDRTPEDDWKQFDITGISYPGMEKPIVDTIHLDALYPKIVKDSWLVMVTDDYEEVYKVASIAESSRKDFTLTAKTMAVQVSGENLILKFNDRIRDTVVFAQSEEVEIAATPLNDAIKNQHELTLERLVPGLAEGKIICVSGKRMRLQIREQTGKICFTVDRDPVASRFLAADDSLTILQQPETLDNGKYKWTLEDSGGFHGTIEAKPSGWTIIASEEEDETVSEIHSIKHIREGKNPTVIVLTNMLTNWFDPATVLINANVVAATHGETKEETLGSGNGSSVFQKFELKQTPLTYTSAATASGTETTLQVWVNDILWEEVSSFYNITAKEKVYTTSISNEGKVTVQFGDGITGARLPTGTENVRASYRVGIGSGGLLDAGQLSLLMSPQLGVSKVTNPVATSGAADPETLDSTRLNAPLTVLTLDRIVSAKDFTDFTRAFAGIGKALAEVLWNGEQRIVHITIASKDEGTVDKKTDLYSNLVSAIDAARHPNSMVSVDSYEPLLFTVNARIKVDAAYVAETVQEEVTNALSDTFSFANRDFGQGVSPSEVIAVIQSVEGVIYTDLESLDGRDPFTKHFRLPSLVARRNDKIILPAQLLVIDSANITITVI